MNLSEGLRAPLRKIFSNEQRRTLKHLLSYLCRSNLPKLALLFGTDKEGTHRYTQHYQHHFKALQRRKLNILEVGVGGYDDPRAAGESLKMWKAYFTNSRIYGIDIHDKTFHDEKRIKTFRGSQSDPAFLKRIAEEIGAIDIIIDDGSHYNEHVITTFKVLFPFLSPEGIYVVEDTQTSYWPDVPGEAWGGSSDLTASHTSMNFFKSMIDGLNYEEFTISDYEPTYVDIHVVAMHFYHNLVFIYKGANNEGSNMLQMYS